MHAEEALDAHRPRAIDPRHRLADAHRVRRLGAGGQGGEEKQAGNKAQHDVCWLHGF
jgi:hypothetical protein